MKIKPIFLFYCIVSCLENYVSAQELAFPGMSGVLTTPDAYTTEVGEINYQFNTYGETSNQNTFDKTYNHVFTAGITPNVELGGRLTDYFNEDAPLNANGTKPGKRDLSANLKLRLPTVHEKLPDVAIGFNDVAGEAVNFSSQYVVASKKIGKGAYSLGYATGDNTDFKGGFGSAAYAITPNAKVMAEYDTQQYQVGGSYDLNERTGVPLSFKVAAPVNGKNARDIAVGVTATLPLDQPFKRRKPAATQQIAALAVNPASALPDAYGFVAQLAKYQFENVSLGYQAKQDYVLAFDNRVYNHNYMDGLGIVLGTAYEFLGNKGTLLVILTDNGIPKLAVKAKLKDIQSFLLADNRAVQGSFKKQLTVWYPAPNFLHTQNIHWLQGASFANKTKVDITLQPDIKTAIGTEWGTFDYDLAARVDVNMPVWKGATVHATADIPVKHTTLFQEDSTVFGEDVHQLGVQQANIQQTFKPSATSTALVSTGLAKVKNKDYYTGQAEGVLLSQTGQTKWYGKVAQFNAKDNNESNRHVALAGVRHEWPEANWSVEANYGKFFEGDKGAHLSVGRRFGDTELTAYTKYINQNDIAAGLQISLPLTPRRDYKKGGVVIRGNERWSYQQQTTVKDPVVVGSNRLRTDMLLEPKLEHSLSRDYLEANKLSPAYVKANIERLREAYVSLHKN